ncbi:MAG: GIY-YIG nuclease family protein [Candidatus Saganbacteria bacterium]|nr:GIY-YIG nuclease family protein [Candidatus Saganbacteria bacterium]
MCLKQAIKSKVSKLPKSPGVYEFLDKQGKILYIGKATSLKDRVGSYFLSRSHLDRPNIEPMIEQIADVKIHETDSVLEALILEANLIKKHQPKYNVMSKDDKSFGYFVVTKEKFPRVIILWKTELGKEAANKIYGPYMSKHQMNIALKLIRRIFPFHSNKQASEKGCLDFQIGKCPGPYAGAISRADYLKNIHGIEMILQGKKKNLLVELKRQMKEYAKKNEFEKAAEARNRIFALNHIRDVALITDEKNILNTKYQILDTRIEAYDISNIAGDYAVGSMTVFQNNHPDKSQYRKFKIKTVSGIDDVAMMREVLYRRFGNDWAKPDLILLDGGKGHLNMAQSALNDLKLDIPVIAVAKGPTRKKLDIFQSKFLLTYLGRNEEIREKYNRILSDAKLLERIRNEAHRFAISYHKKLRRENWKDR